MRDQFVVPGLAFGRALTVESGTFTSARIGGKAAGLATAEAAGLPVPPWFAIEPRAFEASVREGGSDNEGAIPPPEILSGLLPCAEVQVEIREALESICPDSAPVAVRSSALDEDGMVSSFAGQLDSFLCVPAHEVPARVAAVWRSGFGDRHIAYRRLRGNTERIGAPAVLVQRMVDAEVSGVAFSADPVTGRRGIAVVAAVHGLGASLVSGERDGDEYRIDRDGRIVDRTVSSDDSGRPALGDEVARAVAALARKAERVFGCPQDIEWALAGGQLYLLQSRPITTLAERTDPDGAPALWDNSNIVESYGGVTTPLTFSFARRAYDGVYRQFCRLMGVSEARIAEHDDLFGRMLGLIDGRVYYNLLNWYRLLALLPGYNTNREFMEGMMGVSKSVPPELALEIAQEMGSYGATRRWSRLRDRLAMLRTMSHLLRNHLTLPRSIERFRTRLDGALGPGRPDLSGLRPDELTDLYRRLERQLLTRWDAPLVNDFFAMVHYGVLTRLSARWCGDESGGLAHDLLRGEGGMLSAEPAALVRELAQVAAPHPALVDTLCDAPLDNGALKRAMTEVPAFQALYVSYLDRFGERCADELKLESMTLHDDPAPLLRAVGALARRIGTENKLPSDPEGQQADVRQGAEERVQRLLGHRPLRRLLFRWVLRHARIRVRDRENMRLERTRVFGRARMIFLELGRRFTDLGLLNDPRDVFYLEVEEVLGLVDGTAVCPDPRGLVTARRDQFERFRNQPAPPDRFETRGTTAHSLRVCTLDPQAVGKVSSDKSSDRGDERQGTGCCPGVVAGRVRVVADPRGVSLREGDILVAERTDPGWVMLFPAAAGVVVERGSPLSHSAIVARELGLPAVVGCRGVTDWLRDGDLIELDGASGTVRRLACTAR